MIKDSGPAGSAGELRHAPTGGGRLTEIAEVDGASPDSLDGALIASQGLLVAALDAAPDGVLLVGNTGRIIFANEASLRLFGYGVGELTGALVETLVPAGYQHRHLLDRDRFIAAPRRRPMGPGLQLSGLRKDGSEIPVEISLAPLTRRGETVTVTVIRDATEQRALQGQLLRDARSEAVEEIVSGLDAIVWEGTAPDRESMTYLGGREQAFLGYPPEHWLKPGFWLSVVHPDDRIAALTFAETARERDMFELEYRLIDADGAIHTVRDLVSVRRNADGGIDRLSGVIVDLTERLELEGRLSHAQKMEAVGQLAGGIAHDFNNLLTIVSGYARRLHGREDLAGARDELDQIVIAADRAAELTRGLLAFARRGAAHPELLDVSDTVRALEPMLRRLIDADILFRFELEPGAPLVMMDRTELEQVLMNLILNACDAMHDGGTLTVTTHAHHPAASRSQLRGTSIDDGVQISIADTGTGIPRAVRERIFEPFFTTKADKGTGMGLATVFAIVDRAGGTIDLHSTVGEGTTFDVTFPAAPSAEQQSVARVHNSGPTLLVVEDEPALLTLVVRMLEDENYIVLQAGNGLDAIALAERHRGPIDLLLTDIVLPRLSGPELAERLTTMRPGLEVLFMSGYNDSRLASRAIDQANVNLLAKPFSAEELLERVQGLTAAVAVGHAAAM